MKTVLWILVCLLFGIAVAEFVVIAAIFSRQDLDRRVATVEYRLNHLGRTK